MECTLFFSSINRKYFTLHIKKKKYSRKLLFSSAYRVNERYIQICRLINKQHGRLTIVTEERPLCFCSRFATSEFFEKTNPYTLFSV